VRSSSTLADAALANLRRLVQTEWRMSRLSPAVRFVRLVAPLGLAATVLADARVASSDPRSLASPTTAVAPSSAPGLTVGRPNGASYLHLLGRHAGDLLSPSSATIGALVAVPRGKTPADYGLEEVAPGIGRLRATPARIEEFGFAHPDLRLEVGPPLHTLLDRAGQWIRADVARRDRGADGSGVLVGVVDTGLDVTHTEMVDLDGKSRVAWLLDLSLEPIGVYEDLEKKYGVPDASGKIVNGAVFSKQEIDILLGRIASGACVEKPGTTCAPSDEVGHGTHVTGIAAGRGAGGRYPGIAPAADLVVVRGTRGRADGLSDDDVMHAVQFMFDRADFEKRPMVVNISLGSDFGPHDGSLLWETTIASLVGPNFPGRAVVAAAGNVGSIAEGPIHQSVRVTKGATMRVPIRTHGADSGAVQVWVTLREGADLKIGLDGPDGEWIAPVEEGHQNGKNTDDYNAGVIFGAAVANSPIPAASRSAVVVWNRKWPAGTYAITLDGTGMAELYLQGLGDAALGGDREALFAYGVREGTISSPATHPNIIAVGCTVSRPTWTSVAGVMLGPRIPLLDGPGGLPAPRLKGEGVPPSSRGLNEGEICWFSSAGPTATGVPKPEIGAPGAFVISAMSRAAHPGVVGSIFTNPSCPALKSGKTDPRCYQIDEAHGVAAGTSMSAPAVAGVVALLLQKDPTLTQDKIVALLQAGAHRFRYPAPFNDQSGPGEVDAMGSLDALEQMKNPTLHLPTVDQSWLTLSSDYVPADGSSPMTAIVELRTVDGQHRADFFDKGRLQPVLLVDDEPVDSPPDIIRRGPGVWFFTWRPPAGLGGSRATFGATFDGVAIVAPRTLSIASDSWNAAYPSHAGGSRCSVTSTSTSPGRAGAWLLFAAAVAAFARRKK